jgi:hypothetical protein
MTAGYSKNPLIVKLGIKPGMKVRFIDAPAHHGELLGPLPEEVAVSRATRGPLDFIHVFTTSKAALTRDLPNLKKHLAKDGMLWVSWPKKTSSIKSDLNENLIRDVGLNSGLVDVKVCAVDDDWSGLKFVYRLKDR